MNPRSLSLASCALWLACLGCSQKLSSRAPQHEPGGQDEVDVAVDSGAPTDAARPDPGLARLARNIIVFMGDGMGPEQLDTGRVAAGGQLRIDSLAGPALAITDSLTTLHVGGEDPPATDSAAAATWIATGVRVENDVLSWSPEGLPLKTVLELCQRAGKATGLVTTSWFFDASPAAFASHQLSRSFYPEIVREMLNAVRPDVIMGAGGWLFDDPQYGLGAAADDARYAVVRSIPQLAAWDPSAHPRLLGVFETDFIPNVVASEDFTMTPALERTEHSPDPTLAMMTQRALDRLSQDPDGFFLFAEDEITDEIGHRGPAEVAWANRALPAEALAIDEAVGLAIEWVEAHSSFDETLIVVLADHETGGYHFDRALGSGSGEFSAYVDDGTLRVGVHTRRPIEVYARGPGSQAIEQVVSHGDTHQLLLGKLGR